jgi:hypothetical protein
MDYLTVKGLRANLRTLLLVCFLICLVVSTGCGKRVWPEPDVSEEKFALEIKEAKLINKCLRLKIYIKGNYANLSRITLELEPIGPQGECPACPFQVQQSVVFELDTPQIMRKGADLYIKYCQIQKNTDFRVRVKGRNVYPALPDVISNVVTVD